MSYEVLSMSYIVSSSSAGMLLPLLRTVTAQAEPRPVVASGLIPTEPRLSSRLTSFAQFVADPKVQPRTTLAVDIAPAEAALPDVGKASQKPTRLIPRLFGPDTCDAT